MLERLPKKDVEQETNPPQKISRRNFLRASLLGAAAVVVNQVHEVSYGQKQMDKELANSKERKNISHIETQNAMYAIAYNIHEQPSSLETVQNADGLILELIGDYASHEEAVATMNFLATDKAYGDVVRRALDTHTPIFFVDMLQTDEEIDANDEAFKKDFKIRNLVKILETIAGAGLTISVASNIAEEKLTRRDFLRQGVKTVAAGYLLSHVPEKIASDAAITGGHIKDESHVTRQAEKTFGTINARIHPETQPNTAIRNALVAQKAESIARLFQKELGRKPNLAIEIGASHYGIEHELNRSETDRIETLKNALGGQMARQSLIVRADIVPTDLGQKLQLTFLKDEAMEKSSLKK